MGRPASCLAGDGTYLAFACGGEAGARLCCPEDIAAAGGEQLHLTLRHAAQQRPITAMCFGRGPHPPPPPPSAGDEGAEEVPPHASLPDATWLVTASKDAVVLWHVEDAYAVAAESGAPEPDAILLERQGAVDAVAMSPDGAGRVAIAAGAEVSVVATEDCRCLFILEGHAAAVTAIAFSPHAAHQLVTAGEDRTFKVWDLEAGTLLYQSSILCAASLTSISIDPAYPRAAIGAADGVVRFFDLATPACRCVQTVNLDAKLRGALAAAAEAAAAAAGGGGGGPGGWGDDNGGDGLDGDGGDGAPRRISSLPGWKQQQQQQQRQLSGVGGGGSRTTWNPSTQTDGDAGESSAGAGVFRGNSSSSLSAAVCSLHHSALRTDPAASTLSLITARAPPLLVGTPAALLVMDPRTYELVQAIPFASARGGGENGVGMFDELEGAAACFAFGVSPSRSLRCAVSGAFGSSALVVDVEPVELTAAEAAAEAAAAAAAAAAAKVGGGGVGGGGVGGGGGRVMRNGGQSGLDGAAATLAAALAGAEARAAVDGLDTSFERGDGDDGDGIVSIFPTAPLPKGSALLADPVLKSESSTASSKAGSSSSYSSLSSSKRVMQNKPVTFHTKVRSSGYGPEPPRQMFKPRTNGGASAGGKALKKPPSSGGGGGGGAGGAKLQYPSSSDPPVFFQAKHQLAGGAPLHHAAVLRCAYSPDGSRLVTASVDKTARVLRLPLARHAGDGTDLIGHTGAVGAVSWSHDGALVLTSSPADRSACLWQSGKADPLLTFTHVERNAPRAKAGPGGGGAAPLLTPFLHEVRAARFMHLDRFVLLSAVGGMYTLHPVDPIALDGAPGDLTLER
jgi:WD40 repeat protein